MRKKNQFLRKSHLYKRIQSETGIQPKHARDLVDRVFDYVAESLIEGKAVNIHQFGVFKLKVRQARTGHSPFTGVKIQIPEQTVVRFRASVELKEAVRNVRLDADKAG